jgi:hypothetical protein
MTQKIVPIIVKVGPELLTIRIPTGLYIFSFESSKV